VTITELLRMAADAFDDGRDPLAKAFLDEHGVTMDQAMNLAENLAIGARIVADGTEKPRSPAGAIVLRAWVAATASQEWQVNSKPVTLPDGPLRQGQRRLMPEDGEAPWQRQAP
jgi:hypothetical protein